MHHHTITGSESLNAAIEVISSAILSKEHPSVLSDNLALVGNKQLDNIIIELEILPNDEIKISSFSSHSTSITAQAPNLEILRSTILTMVKNIETSVNKHTEHLETLTTRTRALYSHWAKFIDKDDIKTFQDRHGYSSPELTVAIDIKHGDIDVFSVSENTVDMEIFTGKHITPQQLRAIFQILDQGE